MKSTTRPRPQGSHPELREDSVPVVYDAVEGVQRARAALLEWEAFRSSALPPARSRGFRDLALLELGHRRRLLGCLRWP